jgi:hypothetical protein
VRRADRGFVGRPVKRTFRSLSSFNYRAWAGGALVSNVGTWMQRTAQDWLVVRTENLNPDVVAMKSAKDRI